MHRRSFLQSIIPRIAIAFINTSCTSRATPASLPKDLTFVFQEDSITAGMRDIRFEDKPNNIYGLGNSFVTYVARRSVSYWTSDGIHPSTAGDYLLGEAWFNDLLKFY